MRTGITISGTLHLAAIGATILGLPLFEPRIPTDEQPLLVDLVTIAEETTSQPVAPAPKAKPEPEEPPKAAEALPPKPPPKPEPQPAPKPETVARAEPPKPKELVAPPAPEPDPVPAKAEPAPPPKPERPKPEPEPKVAEQPKPEAKPVELAAKPPEPEPEAKPKAAEPSPFAEAPTPKVKPKPKPVAKPEPARPTFDLNRIAALLDKSQKEPASEGEARETKAQAPKQPAQQARIQDKPLTMSEIDAIRYQIEQCWSVPAGARDAEDLVVRIKVYLNPDGTLSRPPEIVQEAHGGDDGFYRTAAESARRAVLQCTPLKHLPTDKYALWRELTLTFNPRQMLGG